MGVLSELNDCILKLTIITQNILVFSPEFNLKYNSNYFNVWFTQQYLELDLFIVDNS